MKFSTTIFLVISFAAIAVFSGFAMNHGEGHGHTGCVAAAAQGGDCPAEEGPLEFLSFHFGALRGFSQASLGDALISGGLLLFLAVLILGVFERTRESIFAASFGAALARLRFVEHERSQGVRLIRWLAFHELSPSFS